MNAWEGIKYFRPEEFRCPCCGIENMSWRYISRLDQLRGLMGVPLVVTSGFRCTDYNRAINGAPDSRHLYGDAADFGINGQDAYRLVSKAVSMGFGGIGLRQHGKRSERFIHIDDRSGAPAVWTYDARHPDS